MTATAVEYRNEITYPENKIQKIRIHSRNCFEIGVYFLFIFLELYLEQTGKYKTGV